jgi:pyruvate ferredoxin oxidoreductase delta subunit
MSKPKVDWISLKRIPLTEQSIERMKNSRATWAWRVFKPVIDEDTCTRCFTCVDYCPDGIIARTDEGPVIDYNLCKGCGVCAKECLFNAINMEREMK